MDIDPNCGIMYVVLMFDISAVAISSVVNNLPKNAGSAERTEGHHRGVSCGRYSLCICGNYYLDNYGGICYGGIR